MHAVPSRARNNYRQFRITLTEQSGGRMTAVGHVKPLRAAWHVKHRTFARTFRLSDPPTTLADCYTVLATLLIEEAASLDRDK